MNRTFGIDPSLPIGVFDSGLGGLTVVREILKQLPHENIIYFGDLARLPYGIKSKRQIADFSRENTEFLIERRVKAIVIACNSSASAAGSELRRDYDIPILDVIRPAAREALRLSSKKRIGVIGTSATITSRAYENILKSMETKVQVFVQACPLFVPLVEEGMLGGEIANAVIEQYVKPLVQKKIDALILGCTHYPLLKTAIQNYVGKGIELIDSASPTVSDLCALLESQSLLSSSSAKGKLNVFVSDLPQTFLKIGEQFLGKKLANVKLVRLTEKITTHRKWAAQVA